MNSDQIASVFLPKTRAVDHHVTGVVESVNADGSYQVKLTGSSGTTRCMRGWPSAEAGDVVLVLKRTNGKCVVICPIS